MQIAHIREREFQTGFRLGNRPNLMGGGMAPTWGWQAWARHFSFLMSIVQFSCRTLRQTLYDPPFRMGVDNVPPLLSSHPAMVWFSGA